MGREVVPKGSMARIVAGIWIAAVLLCAAACEEPIETVPYEVVFTVPHDSAAYTQGLLYHDRFLWESTGRYGESTVRKVDGRTGRVLMSRSLPDSLFGEGLAMVGTELVQLTWKTGVAFVYDLDSLQVRRTLRYDGEGWGLCFDGEHLYMTNGTDSLYARDPETFAIERAVGVTAAGRPVPNLNELECVGEHVFANVYREDRIVQIDKASGRVLRAIDGYQLRLAAGLPYDDDTVLNGIAHDPATGVFFLTGKLWPNLFGIRLLDGS
jgi:glutamine cyclotransferase